MRELLKRAHTTRTGGKAERDDSASPPDAVDLESRTTLFVLTNCEGMEGISAVDAPQVGAAQVDA